MSEINNTEAVGNQGILLTKLNIVAPLAKSIGYPQINKRRKFRCGDTIRVLIQQTDYIRALFLGIPPGGEKINRASSLLSKNYLKNGPALPRISPTNGTGP